MFKKRLKIVLLGNSSVGKTSIAMRYIKKIYKDIYNSTIGCSFYAKTLKIHNLEYGLDLWDTAGQERYWSLLPMYYRNADIILICININEKIDNNIENINYWLKEIDKYDYQNNTRIVSIIGTKSDLSNLNDIENFKDKLKIYNKIIHITSAKDNLGIDRMFENLIMEFINVNPKFFDILENKLNLLDKSNKSDLIEKNINNYSNISWLCNII